MSSKRICSFDFNPNTPVSRSPPSYFHTLFHSFHSMCSGTMQSIVQLHFPKSKCSLAKKEAAKLELDQSFLQSDVSRKQAVLVNYIHASEHSWWIVL